MAKPVRWDLIADPTRYKSGFRAAEQTNQRFDRSVQRTERGMVRFSSRVGRIGPLAVTAFGGAAVAAGGLAAAGAVLGIKTAANLETAEVAFSRLLGSGKRARSFLGELKDFAARTPFELPGLVDAARSLIGAGTAAKDVIPILTSLGDASGALGLDQERFGRVMLAVTQIMNRGKIQAEELNQITEAGIPVWQLLAKATGKPIPELQKLMQSGDLLAKDVLPKLFDQMRKDYGGGMAKQAQTLNGIWSTFKDTISITLADALKPLIPIIKTVLPQAAQAFQRGFQGISNFFRNDLGPELGRVKLAWDENKGAILGLVSTLGGAESKLGSTKDGARSLADVLVILTQTAGDASRFLTNLGNGLDAVEQGSDRLGESINQKLRPGWEWFTERTALGMGTMRLWRGVVGDVKADLADVGIKLGDTAGATDRAATASDRHADALRNQKSALDALNGALKEEESAELDVRQAKLNVQVAQERLNDLKARGKRGSSEYKQAQIDLRRAQINLRGKTDEYKTAQQKANAATSGAMRASAAARPQVSRLGDAARTGGRRADDARIPWRKLGEDVAGAYARIKDKDVDIIAKFGWQGLKVFTPKGGGLQFFAKGGRLPGYGGGDRIPIMAEGGEAVVPKDKANRPEFKAWAGDMGIPGYQRGGRIPNFRMQGQQGMVNALGDWDVQVDKVIGFAARRFKERLEKSFGALGAGAGPGGWRWQMAVLRSAFPGLPLISGFRPGAITATGNRSYHALGRAVDVPPRMDVFNWIRAMFGARTKELIFSPANNRQVWNGRPHLYTGITRRNHFDHVHWAFDQGGMLPPGRTLAINRTGKSEFVLPAGRLEAAFRKPLQSWVVPWLRRIAIGIERPRIATRTGGSGSRAGSGGSGGGGGGSGGVGGRLSARQLANLSDLQRYAYVRKYGAPKPPAGYTWAEDYTLVRRSYYDGGGWLMPGTTVAVNKTSKPERVMGPAEPVIGRREARLIADELVSAMQTAGLGSVYLDSQKVDRRLATARQWNARRG